MQHHISGSNKMWSKWSIRAAATVAAGGSASGVALTSHYNHRNFGSSTNGGDSSEGANKDIQEQHKYTHAKNELFTAIRGSNASQIFSSFSRPSIAECTPRDGSETQGEKSSAREIARQRFKQLRHDTVSRFASLSRNHTSVDSEGEGEEATPTDAATSATQRFERLQNSAAARVARAQAQLNKIIDGNTSTDENKVASERTDENLLSDLEAEASARLARARRQMERVNQQAQERFTKTQQDLLKIPENSRKALQEQSNALLNPLTMIQDEARLIEGTLRSHFGDLKPIDPLAVVFLAMKQQQAKKMKTPESLYHFASKEEVRHPQKNTKGVGAVIDNWLHSGSENSNEDKKEEEEQQVEYSVVPASRGSSVFDVLAHYCRIADIAYGDEDEEAAIGGVDWSEGLLSDDHGPPRRARIDAIERVSRTGEPAHMLIIVEEKQPDGETWKPIEAVLAVRGTVSFSDLLTDAAIEAAEYMTGGHAHAGLLRSGRFLAKKFGKQLSELEESGVSIVTVGHSLGAGAAAICTIELREQGLLEDVHCFAYACPALVDQATADKHSEHITTIVHEDDMIPRCSGFSMLNVHRLAHELDYSTMIASDVVSDLSRFKDGLVDIVGKKLGDVDGKLAKRVVSTLEQGFQERIVDPLSKRKHQAGDDIKSEESGKTTEIDGVVGDGEGEPAKFYLSVKLGDDGTVVLLGEQRIERLLLPGRVMHLYSVTSKNGQISGDDIPETAEGIGEQQDKDEEELVTMAAWVPRERFDHIELSSHCLTDHFVDEYLASLTAMADK